MKRAEMKRGKSPRLSEYEREFEAMKPFVRARSKGICEGMVLALVYGAEPEDVLEAFPAGACQLNATEVHHRKYRQRGGTNALSNLAHLCKRCHDFAHAQGGFGKLANRLGLSLSTGQSEDLEFYA